MTGSIRRTFLVLLSLFLSLGFQRPSPTSRLVEIGNNPGGDQVQVTTGSEGWLYTFQRLWRTTDGGASWAAVSFPRPESRKPGALPPSLVDVTFGRSGHGELIVENSAHFPEPVQQRSVFRTSDGGLTWGEQPPSTLVEAGAQYSQFYLEDGEVGWEGGVEPTAARPDAGKPACKPWWDGRPTRPAIFHTANAGKTWVEQSLPPATGCKVDKLFFRSRNDGIAIAEDDAYYTEDGGNIWRLAEFLDCCTDRDWRTVFSMPPSSAFFIGSAGWLSYEDGYLFKTLDGGKTWRQLARPGQIWQDQPGPGKFGTLFFASDQHGWILGGNGSIYETFDGGARWRRLRNGTPIGSISCSDSVCWAVSATKLYRIEPD
jgi:photosystem II stability/assembly factor-like uncharacterized protein